MQGLFIVLMVLLNVGGVISVILGIGEGNGRWFSTLVMLVLLDVGGFYLLRLLRD